MEKKIFTVQERLNYYEKKILDLTEKLEFAKARYEVLKDQVAHKSNLRSWKDIALEHRASKRGWRP